MRVYDKPITIQRQDEHGKWVAWKKLHAFVNKAKDSASQLIFEVRYTSALKEIFSYLEDFLIVYRGDIFLIEDYDDFMEQHLTVRFRASILRLGKFTGSVTILQKVRTKDAEGFTSQTLNVVSTVRCYHEGREGKLLQANLATFTEATDLFQIAKPADFTLSRAYVLECGGKRYEILSVDPLKGRDLYLQVIAKSIEGAVS